jgi:hypothetical protein
VDHPADFDERNGRNFVGEKYICIRERKLYIRRYDNNNTKKTTKRKQYEIRRRKIRECKKLRDNNFVRVGRGLRGMRHVWGKGGVCRGLWWGNLRETDNLKTKT